ncbi:MAG: ATP-binding cassette, subfamily multidrug efflux pump, partial [Actinomycetota bacterium]|nr:ATP-binding cassette, subfamily multidrug efflux pump [Actinomycetota bacterium]
MTTASTTSAASAAGDEELDTDPQGAEPDDTPDGTGAGTPGGSDPVDSAPSEKALNPRSSGLRMLGLLRPHRLRVSLVLVLAITGVVLNVLGPINLGRATDLIFAGVLSRDLPAGSTKAEVVARLHAEGKNTLADVFSTVNLVPGQGVDFGQVARVLLLVLAFYLAASLFILAQEQLAVTVVQKVAFDLRGKLQAKLARLPLRHFDDQPKGDLLSRVTNDVDNLQQTMHQALSQVISAMFAVVAVLTLMFVISPLLAVILLVGMPIAGVVAVAILKKAQPKLREQWAGTGALNGHVEEM